MTDAQFDVHNFRAICIRHFNNNVFHQAYPNVKFDCFNSFIHKWRVSNMILVRVFHYTRRIQGDPDKIAHFRKEVAAALEEY
jgi:hypothetical protein